MVETLTKEIKTMPRWPEKTEEEKTEAKRKRTQDQIKYNTNNTARLPINLNKNTDTDILDYLATLPNKQGYIKELIRADMQRKNNGHKKV